MLNFLKSLVLPTHMAKHRSMSVLFSICIMVMTCYVFSLPLGNYYIKNKDTFLESEEVYMLALTSFEDSDVEANEAVKVILDAGLSLNENGYMSIKEELGKDYAKVSEDVLAYSRELKVLDEEGNETEETYTETCYIRFAVFFDEDTDGDGDDTALALTDSQICKDFNAIPMVEHEKRVLVVFTQSSIYYQIGQLASEDAELTEEESKLYEESSALSIPYSTSILFTQMDFDIAGMGTTGKSVSNAVAQILSYNYAATNYMMYILVSLLPSCVLFPLLIVLLFWIMFKKNGQLKKFREYLNIYAISSIVPLVLCFIVGFFWIYAIEYYLYVAAIFFLFQLYKINSTPNIV